MKALLFPGQGVQKVGMLNSLFEEVSEVKSIIDGVSKFLDFDLEDLLRNGPEEKINLTEFSQPTILVTSVLLAKYSNKLSNIDITAGLSLGEYSALVYSNSGGKVYSFIRFVYIIYHFINIVDWHIQNNQHSSCTFWNCFLH